MEGITIIGLIVWNIFKAIGVPLRWCWFLGNRTFGDLWDGPNAGIIGSLTLAIIGISWFIIAGWGTNY